MRVGNVTYVPKQLELGSLRGNVFEIVLRDVVAAPKEGGDSSGSSKGEPQPVKEEDLHFVRLGGRWWWWWW